MLPSGAEPSSADFFIWAHRGASAQAPENTLAAFALALDLGADGIELDVHLSRDGVPVVIHDETLERTTDGRGRVAEWTWSELRALDAGRWFAPAFAGEPLPALVQVLELVGTRARLNVEIKNAAAGRAVLGLLQRHPHCRVLVSSFDHRLLARVRRAAPELPLGFLLDSPWWHGALRRARASRAESLNPRQDLVSRPLLQGCRRAGIKIFPWTVDEKGRIAQLRRLGCAGLFTNLPRSLVDAGGLLR